jgi:hypothetical protein
MARGRAEWMKPIDDPILETIRDEGNLTPQALDDFDVTVADYAGKRCKVLAEYGLLEQISRGLYRLTDDGRAYLDEELDASTLDPAEE